MPPNQQGPSQRDRSQRYVVYRLVWCRALALSCVGMLLITGAEAYGQSTPALSAAALAADNKPPSSLAELKRLESRTRDLAQQAVPCTVGLRIGPASGSGIIVDPRGYILTAAHVVTTPEASAEIIFSDGRTVTGQSLGLFVAKDVGLVKIHEKHKGPWPHLKMGDTSKLLTGQWCMALGHPGGYEPGREPVARLGRIMARHSDFLRTDCTLAVGDSGGPLLALDGSVIGIHSRIGTSLIANIHVPVNQYQDSWQRLVKGDVWGYTPMIGVVGAPDRSEARIQRVRFGSPAEEAGLLPGDVITDFDGRPVPDFPTLTRLVGLTKMGQDVKLDVLRESRKMTLHVRVGVKEYEELTH